VVTDKFVFTMKISGLAMIVLGCAGGAAQAASVPLLSGAYLVTQQTFCQIPLTVTSGVLPKGGNYVQSVQSNSTSGNTVTLAVGKLVFTQSKTAPDTGTATLNGVGAGGSNVLLVETGSAGSGTEGAPITQQTNSGNATFSQTLTALTVTLSSGSETYNIYYGKVTGGIAQSAVFGGLDSSGCAESYTLTHS